MPEGRIPPEATGAAVLALHNVAVHRLLPAPFDAALNLATAAGLTTFASQARCSRADLGIRAEDTGQGLRVGLGAAVVVGGAVVTAATLPATRKLFRDRRVSDVGRAEAAYQVTVRIPLATALAEEMLFRGVLLALFRRRHSAAAAVLWTSLLFGAWGWGRVRVISAALPQRTRADPGARGLDVSAYLAGRRLVNR
jgi:uncharacterized protein